MKVRMLFPRTPEEGEYLQNVCYFAARRCRTTASHDALWREVGEVTDEKKATFLDKVVKQDWALDVLEMGYLIFDWEDVPVWLIVELLRHRHIARNFSLEQLSQRAINSDRLKVDVPEKLRPIVEGYLREINSVSVSEGIKPEELRSAYPQGVLVNLVIAGNLNAWQHVFYMRCSKELGGKGGAHPKFVELIEDSFQQAKEVYPLLLKEILPA